MWPEGETTKTLGDLLREGFEMYRFKDSLTLEKLKNQLPPVVKRVRRPTVEPMKHVGTSTGRISAATPVHGEIPLLMSNPCGEILLDDRFSMAAPYYERILLQQLPQERKQMFNVNNLIALADPTWEKDLKAMGVLSDAIFGEELQAEIKAQSDEKRKNAIKAAASQILELAEIKKRGDENLVAELRRIRAEEKRVLKQLEERNEAWIYGSKTSNYLPIANKMGLLLSREILNIDPELLKVKPLVAEPTDKPAGE